MAAHFEKIDKFTKSQYRFNLSLEFFVCAHKKDAHQSEIRLYTFSTLEADMRKFIDDLKFPLGTWEIKIIGPASFVPKLQKLCAEDRIAVAKAVPRDAGFEVIYDVKANKVLLNKTDAPAAVVKPVEQNVPGPKAPKRPIRVMIVDDSSTIIHLLTKIFTTDPDIEVVATCENPLEAEAKIRDSKPDVITMDIHMPGLDGVALVKKVFPVYKLPIIMISSISLEEGPQVLAALENGAVDYIQKPTLKDLDQVAPMIIERIKIASEMDLKSKGNVRKKRASGSHSVSKESMIVIGSSTGGTEALKTVLESLPPEIPPILIVQHIPPVFSTAFAKRLNEICPFKVKEGEDGEKIVPNCVYIAPGGVQMSVVKKRDEYQLKIEADALPVNRHKPSVDYLFKSVVDLKIPRVVAAILTGMGADGAREIVRLRQGGARTIAQDKETSIVYGMPREAFERGGAEFVLPLDEIGDKLMYLCTDAAHDKKRQKAS